jgi:hypothetical protein
MSLKKLYEESKRHITTLLFIGGFVFDLLILPEAGHIETIILGSLYLTIVAVCIALREWVISRNKATKQEQKVFSILTFMIAYFSGSALSFVCVYVIRGAALAVSWPLLVILFICVLTNEIVSSHHFRFTLDIGVFLTALLFFVIFNLPVVLKIQNDGVFILSTLTAVFLSLLYLYILQFTSESAKEEAPRLYALGVGIPMFIGMLYFLNVIPAVPLSLASSGVYHSVVKNNDGSFVGVKEKDVRFLEKYRTDVYHLRSSDSGVYFFSSVNAPAELTAPISHVWEKYDPIANSWKREATISFRLDGGREHGYRAYSHKENVTEGKWRVTIKVGEKRVVGRVNFLILKDEGEKELETLSL